MAQGDLTSAVQLYKESTAVRWNKGIPTMPPSPVKGIAYVRQLQGDLVGAKQGFEQSLATWQKNGVQYYSAYAMWNLGSLLLQESDFSGSRKMYEQALALRTAAGDKITIAETQLALADLSLEEARSPAEQETVVRQALEVFQTQKVRDDETEAWCVLARALLAEGKAAAAKDAMQHARSLAAKSQNPEIRWRTAITAARIETAETNLAHSAAGTAGTQRAGHHHHEVARARLYGDRARCAPRAR